MWKIKTTAQSTSDLSQKNQTSEIYLKTSDLMLKHQKWQHRTVRRFSFCFNVNIR